MIAIIAGQLPPEAQRLVLRLKRRTGTVVANVVLDPLRRFQSSDGLTKDLAFAEFLGRATLNGRPVLPQRHVRFMLATFVSGLLGRPSMRSRRPFRKSRQRRDACAINNWPRP